MATEFTETDWEAVYNEEQYKMLVASGAMGGLFTSVEYVAQGLDSRGSNHLGEKVRKGAFFVKDKFGGDDTVDALFSFQMFIDTIGGLISDGIIGNDYFLVSTVINGLLVTELGSVKK